MSFTDTSPNANATMPNAMVTYGLLNTEPSALAPHPERDEHEADAEHEGHYVGAAPGKPQLLVIDAGGEYAHVDRKQRQDAGREKRQEPRSKCGDECGDIHIC